MSLKNWDNKTWLSSKKYIQSFLIFLLKQIKLKKDSQILDIGCGGGLISEPMARLGANVTGIDASEKNIKIAKIHSEENNLKKEKNYSNSTNNKDDWENNENDW